MNCKDCQKPLCSENKSGYCQKHVSAHMRDKISAGLRLKLEQDPAYLERCRVRARANCNSTKFRQASAEAARHSGAWRKALAAATPESYLLGGRRAAATKLAWCPSELRDQYRDLVNRKKFKANEARAIILAQHEKNMANFRRKLGAV